MIGNWQEPAYLNQLIIMNILSLHQDAEFERWQPGSGETVSSTDHLRLTASSEPMSSLTG